MKETSIHRNQATDARFSAVQSYLEREFPGRVGKATEDSFEVLHGPGRHQVVIHPEVWQGCTDYTNALRESELGDYMREAQSQVRRFVILWQDHEVRVRSTQL
jgi:hypothetical protein